MSNEQDADKLRKLEAAIQAQEALRGILPDEQVNAAIDALKGQYQAVLTGSGQVVQGAGNRAANQQAVLVEGSITDGIVVTGQVLGSIYKIYQSPPGRAALDQASFERILNDYLHWVQNAYSKARLYGLESLRTAHGQPVRQLADVFVPLSLRRFRPVHPGEIDALLENSAEPYARARTYFKLAEQRQEEGDLVPLERLLTVSKRLAIIGGAGCGKSTLLAYLAASLAASAGSGKMPAFQTPEKINILIPLVIPLRYYREYLDLCKHSPQERLIHPRAGTLAGFVPWYLKRRSPALEVSEDFFDRLLLGGGCLLMLDGLDEVTNRDARGQVRQQVENLANDVYPSNHLIVTAREAGYQENAVFGDDFTRLDVQRLDDEQIEALVNNWCRQLYPGEQKKRTRELMNDIQGINDLRTDRDLLPLVSTPLMTSMVVSVKWGETELPRERAKLYEAAVRVILQAQYIPDDPARKELVGWGGLWEEQRDWLSLLALEMHSSGRSGAAVPEERVRAVLSQSLPVEKLEQFIQATRLRGGLFEEKAELFQFIHLTFQEFLAARLLVKQRDLSRSRLQHYLADPWWREVLLLIYGFAQADYAPFAQEYLNWLSRQDGECRLAGLELAGAALLELEKPNPELRQAQARLLAAALEDPTVQATPALRSRAGSTLARLGDPRFDPDCFYLPKDPMAGFVEIPAGKFRMGSDKEKDPGAHDDEQTQHEIDLTAFYMGRCPVTVAQFQAFVAISGHKPRHRDSQSGPPNHPVVSVNWYDAMKYCEWLAERLKPISRQRLGISGLTSAKQHFWEQIAAGKLCAALPSEAQWEKAARGTDGRIYPWGAGADPDRANYGDTGIGAASAVGSFPGGASPYGCLDMSGNVWEWTRSLWGKDWAKPEYGYPYHEQLDERENLEAPAHVLRVLRGGSFDDRSRSVRCADRYRFNPDGGLRDVGFRVCLSPSP